MSYQVNSRWLLILPTTETANLTLSAVRANDCTLPGFDFDGGTMSGGSSPIFTDLLPAKFVAQPINYTFLVDEKFENYIEVLKMAFSAFTPSKKNPYFDFTIKPLDTNGKDFGLDLKFIRGRILSVSPSNQDNNATLKYQTCTVSLKYESFEVILNGEKIISLGN